jgi:uncharacterized protein YjiS (DUF1127 family)
MVRIVTKAGQERAMSIDIRGVGRFGRSQSGGLASRVALRLCGLLDDWSERHRQRRALLELSDHMLRDIGIGRSEAYQEGRKPFWRG